MSSKHSVCSDIIYGSQISPGGSSNDLATLLLKLPNLAVM